MFLLHVMQMGDKVCHSRDWRVYVKCWLKARVKVIIGLERALSGEPLN